MQLCIRRLPYLALLVGVLALAATAFDTKVYSCCTKTSTMNITDPILSYRIQKKNFPCVQAVIFETPQGEVCVHLKQRWVLNKIKELQTKKNSTAVPATESPSP